MARRATLWGIKQSHSVLTARLLLERAGVEYRAIDVWPGLHPLAVRAAGFDGWTVPALRLDGRRIVGSLAIARALADCEGARPVYPADPGRRAAVEAAERWGHDELQPPARRLFRWGGVESNVVRAWLVREVMRLPAAALVGQVCRPLFVLFARVSGATTAQIQRDLAELPAKLDHADALIASGTIGGDEPNAADCQILASLRLLLAFDDLRALVEPHPCGQAALRFVPHFPAPPPAELPSIPPILPAAWLPAVAAA